MVFHQLVDSRSGVDVEQIVVELNEPLAEGHLRVAWNGAMAHNSVLRSYVLRDEQGQFELGVADEFAPTWTVLQVGEAEWADGAYLARVLEEDRAQGFDLFAGPPIRFTLLEISRSQWVFLWTFHHILCDGRSFPDLLVEVFDRYDALISGESYAIEPRPSAELFQQWRADWADSQALEYWRSLLAGFDHATPFVSADAPGTNRADVEIQLSDDQTAGLSRWATENGLTLNALVQAAWAMVLSRHCEEETVVFGATRAGRAATVPDADRMVGVFINSVPVVARLAGQTPRELASALRQQQIDGRPHEHAALTDIQRSTEIPPGQPLFRTLLMFDKQILNEAIMQRRRSWTTRKFRLHERTPYPVTIYAYAEPALFLKLSFDADLLSRPAAERCLEQVQNCLSVFVENPDVPLDSLSILGPREYHQLVETWNDTGAAIPATTIHEEFAAQANSRGEQTALIAGDQKTSYRELDERSARLAERLQALGVGPGSIVGLSVSRSTEMVVAVLAILRAGGAYLPLDPEYPAERLLFCVRDAGVRLLITERSYKSRFSETGVRFLCTDEFDTRPGPASIESACGPDDLAYLIYTSGSTGQPNGVLVEHRNVVNFFTGMDDVVRHDKRKTWLAVTSLSFDISVLELLWTLTRGYTVVLHGALASAELAPEPVAFSLFYFANEPDHAKKDPYRLVLEGARFADDHGFEAIWTPERHFHAFGGLYPNPSVMGAAIAASTRNLEIRAGSVVLPLHSPFRVAEEWAVVDNLSNGRVGIACASGWQPNDFVLAPENYERRHQVMYDNLEQLRALWRGEKVQAENPKGDRVEIGTLPRPVQPELPVWITAAGSPATYEQAGRIGANVLTHLLGQTIEDLSQKIALYRAARKENGHDPDAGRVTLMLHTFVGPENEAVKQIVRGPMKDYLRGSASLVGQYADAWTAYNKGPSSTEVAQTALEDLSPDEFENLLEFAFERYFETSSLLGSPEKCVDLVNAVTGVGVSEIACLVDFGVDVDAVLQHLPYINDLRELLRLRALRDQATVAEDIVRHQISHMQCTPSMARMLPLLSADSATYGSIEQLLIGGEALPSDLVTELQQIMPETRIVNMYGPTETTIWSTIDPIAADFDRVTIGRPIANTRCFVLDKEQRLVPQGRPGELYIGGEGVTRGYHNREELDQQRFISDPFDEGKKLYATGDVVRYGEDGRLEFLERVDHQIKIRGHRVELGEIEVSLRAHPEIDSAVVVARDDSAGTKQLVAYYVLADPALALANTSLREFIRKSLPDFMVPNHFLAIDAIPLTPNGKIDRKALPNVDASTGPRKDRAFQDASNESEKKILDIWKQVLGLGHISVTDNFFDLGGHSILAVKMQGILSSNFDRHLSVTDLFRFPTVKALADYLDDGGHEAIQTGLDRSEARAQARRASRGRQRRGR